MCLGRRGCGTLALPSMASALIAGIRLAIVAAWGCVVLVEWFGSNEGAGFRAPRDWYQSAANYNGLMAWGIVVLVVVIIVDRGSSRGSIRGSTVAAIGRRLRCRQEHPDGRDRGVLSWRSSKPARSSRSSPADEAPAHGESARRDGIRDIRPDLRNHGRAVGLREEHLPQHRLGCGDAHLGVVLVTADDGSPATLGYVFQDPRLLPGEP